MFWNCIWNALGIFSQFTYSRCLRIISKTFENWDTWFQTRVEILKCPLWVWTGQVSWAVPRDKHMSRMVGCDAYSGTVGWDQLAVESCVREGDWKGRESDKFWLSKPHRRRCRPAFLPPSLLSDLFRPFSSPSQLLWFPENAFQPDRHIWAHLSLSDLLDFPPHWNGLLRTRPPNHPNHPPHHLSHLSNHPVCQRTNPFRGEKHCNHLDPKWTSRSFLVYSILIRPNVDHIIKSSSAPSLPSRPYQTKSSDNHRPRVVMMQSLSLYPPTHSRIEKSSNFINIHWWWNESSIKPERERFQACIPLSLSATEKGSWVMARARVRRSGVRQQRRYGMQFGTCHPFISSRIVPSTLSLSPNSTPQRLWWDLGRLVSSFFPRLAPLGWLTDSILTHEFSTILISFMNF